MGIHDAISGWSSYISVTKNPLTLKRQLNLFTSQQSILTLFPAYQFNLTLFILDPTYQSVDRVYYYANDQVLVASSPVLVVNTTAAEIGLTKKVQIIDDMLFEYTEVIKHQIAAAGYTLLDLNITQFQTLTVGEIQSRIRTLLALPATL